MLSALLAACTSTVTGAASPATGPAATASPSQLDGALLTLDDLPAGWTAQPDRARASGLSDAFAACLGSPREPEDRLEVAISYFSDASGNTVFSSISRYRSQERLEADVALFADVRAPACFSEALIGVLDVTPLPRGVSAGTPDVTVSPGGGGDPGDVVAVVTADIPMTTATDELTDVMQYVFVAGRSTQAVVGFSSLDAELPPELRHRAVDAVAERIADL